MASILKMIEQDKKEYENFFNFEEKKVFNQQQKTEQLRIYLEHLCITQLHNLKDNHNIGIAVLKGYSEKFLNSDGKLLRDRNSLIQGFIEGFIGYAIDNNKPLFSNKYLIACLSEKLNKRQKEKITKELKTYLVNNGYAVVTTAIKRYYSMNYQEELKTIGCDCYSIMMRKYRKDRHNTPIALNNKSWKLRQHKEVVKGYQLI